MGTGTRGLSNGEIGCLLAVLGMGCWLDGPAWGEGRVCRCVCLGQEWVPRVAGRWNGGEESVGRMTLALFLARCGLFLSLSLCQSVGDLGGGGAGPQGRSMQAWGRGGDDDDNEEEKKTATRWKNKKTDG